VQQGFATQTPSSPFPFLSSPSSLLLRTHGGGKLTVGGKEMHTVRMGRVGGIL